MTKKPLALLLRPQKISDVIGQSHILNNDSLINRMLKNKVVFSLILYGPPGIGKTSIANALANDLKVNFDFFNPVIDKKEKLVKIIENAKKSNNEFILIIDEIHRLNKDKQDILLPFLEDGTIKIFATTTENPYFMINPAIRSRCQIIQLNPISKNEAFAGLKKILKNNQIKISDDILKEIINQTNGDLRSILNVIDIIDKLYKNNKIEISTLKDIMQQSFIIGSHYGDEYYDLLSAFHKSLRGSDVNASIYYLARLLLIGDLESISRRMIAMAYEDIGLANPSLCERVVIGIQAAKEVGFPENKQILSDLVIELCLSPKSNSGYLAIMSALKDVENGQIYSIPKTIRDSSYKSANKLGVIGYKYPHDFPNSYVAQQYLPKELISKKYYVEKDNIIEKKINAYLKSIK